METIQSLICISLSGINLIAALQPNNDYSFVNWIACGFCFGIALIIMINNILRQ